MNIIYNKKYDKGLKELRKKHRVKELEVVFISVAHYKDFNPKGVISYDE